MQHDDERERGAASGARSDASSQAGAQAPRPTGSAEAEAPMDLSAMDLSIEPVEERISPGETNVFDK